MVVEEKCIFALQESYLFQRHPNLLGSAAGFRLVVYFIGGPPTTSPTPSVILNFAQLNQGFPPSYASHASVFMVIRGETALYPTPTIASNLGIFIFPIYHL